MNTFSGYAWPYGSKRKKCIIVHRVTMQLELSITSLWMGLFILYVYLNIYAFKLPVSPRTQTFLFSCIYINFDSLLQIISVA
ncbi:hypothetical protein CAAN1_05S05006 [[Candida] anglica]|uniref:Uncharacterized protein n=1 Tax=[Candida] anglica TaxID=148631 RepID=A0ABP0ED81_9ASCO